ncbi:MAG: hypothetical protein ABIB71_01715 [Candidatus Woesearchaeota archaeon]
MEKLYCKNNQVFTQIGSLPFTDTKQAIEYSLKHDIPFLPELPKLGDGMLEYIKNPGKMSCLEDFCKEKFETLKVQCIGPSTLLQDPKNNYTEDEAVDRVYRHIAEIIWSLNASEYMIFLDEPSLGYGTTRYEELWEPIMRSIGDDVIWGVHVCGNMMWDHLFDSDMKIISFDASQQDITLYYPRMGKQVAWGIEKEEDIKDWQEGDLITLPCGLGTKDEKHAYDSLDMLLKVSSKFR